MMMCCWWAKKFPAHVFYFPNFFMLFLVIMAYYSLVSLQKCFWKIRRFICACNKEAFSALVIQIVAFVRSFPFLLCFTSVSCYNTNLTHHINVLLAFTRIITERRPATVFKVLRTFSTRTNLVLPVLIYPSVSDSVLLKVTVTNVSFSFCLPPPPPFPFMYKNSSVTVRIPRAAQNGIEGRMRPVGRGLRPLTPELTHQ